MKIITFEDHGQDFLTWEVDSAGQVVSSLPFQGTIWGGSYVMNHETLRAGGRACIHTPTGKGFEINYPIVSVTKRPSKFAIERAPLPGQISQLKRFMTKCGGWTNCISKAAIFITRGEAEKRNWHNDQIIEV